MVLNDRFTLGAIAGLIGGLAQSVITLTAHALDVCNLRWLDFAETLMFSHLPRSAFETVFAWVVMQGWCTALGVIYSFTLIVIREPNHRLKGISYGLFVWFLTYAFVTAVFKHPQMKNAVDASTVTLHAIASALWGFVTAEVYYRLSLRHRPVA